MAHNLKVVYDESALEAWIPEFDVGPEYDREPGPYEMFSNAKLKAELGWCPAYASYRSGLAA